MRKISDTAPAASCHPPRVRVVAIPGTPVFELAIACEVFGIDRSDLVPGWYDFAVCPTAPGAEIAAGFVAGQPGTLDELTQADSVIVPGCRSVQDAAPPALLDALRAADRRGARIAAICSGAFVLAEAGLLDGRQATTHWMHADDLARRYPAVTVTAPRLYIQQGNVWTSAGTAAGIDLCLELVRCDFGAAVATELAARMVVPPHRDGSQAQYVRRPVFARSARIGDLADWGRHNLGNGLTVARLARHASVSERTLIRWFSAETGLTPQRWILRERLSLARELLETTHLSVDRVAEQSGLGSAANLRTQFRTQLGVTPTGYRRAFGHEVDPALGRTEPRGSATSARASRGA
jgi:transcriptional regulator GlxA family with amidase domain